MFLNISNIFLKVYSWGSNEGCRLGREWDGNTYKKIYMPAKMDSLSEEHIIDIASNTFNSLALTNNGKVNNDQSIKIMVIFGLFVE